MKAEDRIYYIKGLVDNELINTKHKIFVNLTKFEDNDRQDPQDIELGHTLVEVKKQLDEIIKELKQ
jgi:hypothetical protein|tara:strand:+ start:77 stop:274 length:198 start_codon:yes stop_codon:yes gene_type:complete